MTPAPKPEKLWVVVARHARSSSMLPFTVASTRQGAWTAYVDNCCGSARPIDPQYSDIYELISRRRAAGDLTIERAVLEVGR